MVPDGTCTSSAVSSKSTIRESTTCLSSARSSSSQGRLPLAGPGEGPRTRPRPGQEFKSNAKSSSSHAIFQIVLLSGNSNQAAGKFSLIDLPGSERASNNFSTDSQACQEAAELIKFLLVLKECIRALERKEVHWKIN
ncbi:kinesin-like protein Klp59C [Drosophila subobscura]|uniref:kinesin-like protein Klp59C n=1 Tax=Drosophila subobscura TaxID=7241 RepID=UPI00155AB3B0|nr:kinesin-like protein Klp59C [Drosophila subobscura]